MTNLESTDRYGFELPGGGIYVPVDDMLMGHPELAPEEEKVPVTSLVDVRVREYDGFPAIELEGSDSIVFNALSRRMVEVGSRCERALADASEEGLLLSVDPYFRHIGVCDITDLSLVQRPIAECEGDEQYRFIGNPFPPAQMMTHEVRELSDRQIFLVRSHDWQDRLADLIWSLSMVDVCKRIDEVLVKWGQDGEPIMDELCEVMKEALLLALQGEDDRQVAVNVQAVLNVLNRWNGGASVSPWCYSLPKKILSELADEKEFYTSNRVYLRSWRNDYQYPQDAESLVRFFEEYYGNSDKESVDRQFGESIVNGSRDDENFLRSLFVALANRLCQDV